MAFDYSKLWKENWEETRTHFVDWWNRDGFLVASWDAYLRDEPCEKVRDPGPFESLEQLYTDAEWRSAKTRWDLSRMAAPLDVLPCASADLGPGSLGTFLGSEPEFAEDTVWYRPFIVDPETHPPLRFDPESRWWKVHEAILRAHVEASRGHYFVGCPDLIENLDTLAALRDSEKMLFDLIERPAWVKEKLAEINQAFFEAYDRIYEIIRCDDGGAVFSPFCLWAPGKVAKVQCDAAAMISPAMFDEFVVPALREQCEWLDYSMFHLDGTQAIVHLDSLLSIDALDAIEWTPQAGRAGGGSPEWYDLYRRITEAGKSIQAVSVAPGEVIPLLDAVGADGLYMLLRELDRPTADELEATLKPYRK